MSNNKNRLPFCTIVTVTYNAREFIEKCINSLLRLNYPKNRYQIVVVDNNSMDGSADFVKKKFPSVKVIANKQNVGFGTGNNIVFRKIKSDYYALINPDTVVDKNWLIEMMKVAESDKSIGICTSKLMMMHGNRNIINFAGGEVNFLGFAWSRGLYEVDKKQFEKTEETKFASGASTLIKWELIRKIGYFDDDYFMYYEDADYSWRARMFGYKVFYVPKSIVYHKYSASVKRFMTETRKLYLLERNRLASIIKNYSLKVLLLLLPLLIFVETALAFYYLLFRIDAVKFYSISYVIRNFNHILEKRFILQRSRTVDDREIIEGFTHDLPRTAVHIPEFVLSSLRIILRVYTKILTL